jgi:hydrogenase maturation protease
VNRILVAGVGNLFLGDDGFGPEVVRRMVERGLPEGVRAVDYGIRGMHLAYDLLDPPEVLILVDAVPYGSAAGEVSVFEVREGDLGDGEFDAHGMDPVAVLASVRKLGGTLPRTYVVGVRPADLAEGIGLSADVQAAMPETLDTLADLLAELLAELSQPTGVRSS